MQATDSLIRWAGTSRLTVGICERFVQDLAVGQPYSGLRPRALALRREPMRGKLHLRYVEERRARTGHLIFPGLELLLKVLSLLAGRRVFERVLGYVSISVLLRVALRQWIFRIGAEWPAR